LVVEGFYHVVLAVGRRRWDTKARTEVETCSHT
jgi:hypothetical protein